MVLVTTAFRQQDLMIGHWMILAGTRERQWDFCINNSIHFKASHLPCVQNALRNLLSRLFSSRLEWSLCPDMARFIFQWWDRPLIDQFATKINRKCHQFCFQAGHSPTSLMDVSLCLSQTDSCMHFLQVHST